MVKNKAENKQEYEQTQSTTNEHILTIMQEAIKQVRQIREEALKKLLKTQAELENAPADTPYASKLKTEEQYYSKALNEVQVLEKSIQQNHSHVEGLSKSEKATIQDVVIDVKMPQPKEKKDDQLDAEMIQRLRGLTPGQNLFLKEQSTEALKVIKADISYTNLNDEQKIRKLRKGISAYYIGKKKSKTRKERQLSKREREMLNSLAYSRLKERGSRTKA